MASYEGRNDAMLVRMARDDDHTAFAVLLHRTLPRVWEVVSPGAKDTRRAVEATHATYVDALAALGDDPVPSDATTWIVGLAQRHTPRRRRAARRASSTLPVGLEDELWLDLEHRWPGQRRRTRRHVPWTRVGVAVALVLAAALLPMAFLGLPEATSQPVARQTGDPEPAAPPAPDPSPDAPALPDFTFPTPPAVAQPEQPPTTFEPAESEPESGPLTPTDPPPAAQPSVAASPRPTATQAVVTETAEPGPGPTGEPEPSEATETPDDDASLPLPGDPSEEAADDGTEGETTDA